MDALVFILIIAAVCCFGYAAYLYIRNNILNMD